jgi:MoaA/NifB/PqqE/SkfB family radical SAM enzyme
VDRICEQNPELHLDLNIAMDGLYEMQDSIRAVPGNFAKTLETIEAIQACRQKYPLLRININTVICSENFEQVMAIAEFVKMNCTVDGHYFNVIRGAAKDASLKQIPNHRLAALYCDIQAVYDYYADQVLRRRTGVARKIAQVYYQGTLALHNKIQLENIAGPHPWPMPCTAGDTSIVIDFNGDVRSCELRGKLANLRDYDCDFEKFWLARERQEDLGAIVQDQCWCTHICFIHDSLRHSPKVLLYDIPITYLESKFTSPSAQGDSFKAAPALATPTAAKCS